MYRKIKQNARKAITLNLKYFSLAYQEDSSFIEIILPMSLAAKLLIKQF